MTTKTIRLPGDLTAAISDVGTAEHIEESVAIRKLLRMGYGAYVAEQYRQGRVSLRTAARETGLSLSEALDAFARMGIPGNVSADATLRSLHFLSASRSARRPRS